MKTRRELDTLQMTTSMTLVNGQRKRTIPELRLTRLLGGLEMVEVVQQASLGWERCVISIIILTSTSCKIMNSDRHT